MRDKSNYTFMVSMNSTYTGTSWFIKWKKRVIEKEGEYELDTENFSPLSFGDIVYQEIHYCSFQ